MRRLPKAARLDRVRRVSIRLRELERILPADVALAREAGASLGEIAEAAGLSREGIRKMLVRRAS